jgi:outer membrane protein OmpA-like peptidoglycan-associated protein
MMKKIDFSASRVCIAAVTTLFLAACASTPVPNPELESARSAYESAAADPFVAKAAPAELGQAKEALKNADAAWVTKEKPADVNHYAYLAKQRTQTAVEAGRLAKAEEAAKTSNAQRDKILIDARTQEADRAKSEAEAAQARAQAAQAQAQAAAARAGSLEAQMNALKARPTERGMVLTLGDVLFDTGLATLKPGAMRTVDQLAKFLAGNPSHKVLIEGHTDSVGSDALNETLSQHRAEAVQAALTQRGVSSDRVQVSGLGKRYPVASNTTNAGRQQNRRVEIIFSDASGSIKARSN